MLEQDPVEGRQRETNADRPGIMLEQDPVEGRQRERKVEIMLEQDPVEGRQRKTKVEIMLEQDPVEGRQRETNGDRPGNHVGTKSVSLQELRTPSAEAVCGKIGTEPVCNLGFPQKGVLVGTPLLSHSANDDKEALSTDCCAQKNPMEDRPLMQMTDQHRGKIPMMSNQTMAFAEACCLHLLVCRVFNNANQ